MKLVNALLFAVLLAIQYPLWFKDKAGWLWVWEQQKTLAVQVQHNQQLQMRNAALAADVQDLKTGTDAIEERARKELGMIQKNEIFVQILQD